MPDPKVTREHRQQALHIHRGNVRGIVADRWIADGEYHPALEVQQRIAEALATLEAEALERGRREERERVVYEIARLCGANRTDVKLRDFCADLANAIERGDHLKGGESG